MTNDLFWIKGCGERIQMKACVWVTGCTFSRVTPLGGPESCLSLLSSIPGNELGQRLTEFHFSLNQHFLCISIQHTTFIPLWVATAFPTGWPLSLINADDQILRAGYTTATPATSPSTFFLSYSWHLGKSPNNQSLREIVTTLSLLLAFSTALTPGPRKNLNPPRHNLLTHIALPTFWITQTHPSWIPKPSHSTLNNPDLTSQKKPMFSRSSLNFPITSIPGHSLIW